MHKLVPVLFPSFLCAAASVVAVGGTPAFAAGGTHTGASAAPHMQLKDAGGGVVCSAYNTSVLFAPVAHDCPGGTYTEQLFDAGWSMIDQRTVTVGNASSSGGTPIGGTRIGERHTDGTRTGVPARNTNPLFTRYADYRSDLLPVDQLTVPVTKVDDGDSSLAGAPGDGNFRVTCQYSHFNRDDPIVYPGQPGRSHLHMFFGNTKTDAYTTGANVADSGGGTCNGFELNRSAYWTPAVLDGKGNAVVPETILLYYKTKQVTYQGRVVHRAADIERMPQGLKLIAGNAAGAELTAGNTPHSFNQSQHLFWSCGSAGATSPNSETDRIPNCGSEPINATIYFPQCWDGRLDSPDHQSHVAQAEEWEPCPASHPRRLPRLGILLYYPPQSTQGWRLASDHVGPNMVAGGTLHADWIGGWHDGTMDRWIDNCLRNTRNCTFGQTGTTRSLKRLYGGQPDDYTGRNPLPISGN